MRRLIGLLAVLITWVVIFYTSLIITELVLVPWDTAPERPEIGTWQRTLNDFFETPPGSMVIAALLVAASVVLLLRNRRPAYFRLAIVNLIFVVGVFGLLMAAALLNNALFPYPDVAYDPSYPGYYRSVLPGLVVAGVCAGWLWWQRKLTVFDSAGDRA